MSELLDTPLNAIKEAVVQRINTPIFGFVFISWVFSNWEAILYLSFSKYPIEYRISHTTFLYIWPIIAGVILAAIYPYTQFCIEWLHNKATELRYHNESLRKSYKIKDDEIVKDAEFEVKLNNNVRRIEKENKEKELELQHKNEMHRIDNEHINGIKTLQEKYKKIEFEINVLGNENNKLIQKQNNINQELINSFSYLKKTQILVEKIISFKTKADNENDMESKLTQWINLNEYLHSSEVNEIEEYINALKNIG